MGVTVQDASAGDTTTLVDTLVTAAEQVEAVGAPGIVEVVADKGIVNLASCWQSYRMPSYRGYRFPPEIISHAVWLYHRFALSFRDVEDLLARRGVEVTVMPSVPHCTDQYANNRAEVSHQPTRQRERQMGRFTSAAQLQRFASVHGIVQNLFRVGRHLLRSAHHRLLRTRAFVEWDAVTCAC